MLFRSGIGMDPGGGKKDSSVSQVIDSETYEQVAALSGLVEPTEFANQTHDLSLYYFGASVLFELNNHGGTVLAQFKERGTNMRRGIGRRGVTDKEPGWLTTERSKHMLYDVGAKVMQEVIYETLDDRGEPHFELVRPILFDPSTIAELTSIDVSELEAPLGMHDDHSMAWVLACMCVYRGTSGVAVARHSLWKEPQQVSAPAGSAAPAIPGSGPRERPVERGFPPAFENERLVYEKLKRRGL